MLTLPFFFLLAFWLIMKGNVCAIIVHSRIPTTVLMNCMSLGHYSEDKSNMMHDEVSFTCYSLLLLFGGIFCSYFSSWCKE